MTDVAEALAEQGAQRREMGRQATVRKQLEEALERLVVAYDDLINSWPDKQKPFTTARPAARLALARARAEPEEACPACAGLKWVPVYDFPPEGSGRPASGTTRPCPECTEPEEA